MHNNFWCTGAFPKGNQVLLQNCHTAGTPRSSSLHSGDVHILHPVNLADGEMGEFAAGEDAL